MVERISGNLKDQPATAAMLPKLLVWSTWILAIVDKVLPILWRGFVWLWTLYGRIAQIGKFRQVTITTMGAGYQHLIPLLQPGEGASATFVNGVTRVEAVQCEWCVQRVRPVICNCMGKAPTRSRCRFETTIAPSGIQIETG